MPTDRDSFKHGTKITVTVNEEGIVANKSSFTVADGQRRGKVDRFTVAFAEGYDALLVIERYDDRSNLPSSPTMLFDPRYEGRAVRYSVGPDHLVHTIQIVQTDGLLQVPE